jgi:hypothetical protein
MADLEALRAKLQKLNQVKTDNETMELIDVARVSQRQLLSGFNITEASLKIFLDSNGLETDPKSACRHLVITSKYVGPNANMVDAFLNRNIIDVPKIYDDIPDNFEGEDENEDK